MITCYKCNNTKDLIFTNGEWKCPIHQHEKNACINAAGHAYSPRYDLRVTKESDDCYAKEVSENVYLYDVCAFCGKILKRVLK